MNNGKENAKCGAGVWFGPDHSLNKAIRIPGQEQSNQIGELGAIIAAVDAVPLNQPLKIISDSRYAIDGLTDNLGRWEDKGWIGIQNAALFKKAAFLMRRRAARTSFQWIKGHSGDQGNEGSDQLAKEGAEKDEPDALDLSIPPEFDLQGAKLVTLSQSIAYQGIRERRKPQKRDATDANLKRAKTALQEYTGMHETSATIWKGTRNKVIRTTTRQFFYRIIHQTPKVGTFRKHVLNWEHRQMCRLCNKIESMEHILTECDAPARVKIWQFLTQRWPHEHIPLPEFSFGIILGCRSLALPENQTEINGENPNHQRKNRGVKRLLQILISESAYLIWVLRCERVIQNRPHSDPEIETRWLRVINKRLIDDKITVTRIKRDRTHIKITNDTWEAILLKEGELPDKWMAKREVLVGRTSA